mmetsp:Transcript_22082/g.77403  ORF Transcript_22082/g.77403 Transcript_22082/m.77403 type:complete len:402 (-) Transcript_22082:146-1351(-)
MERGVLLLHRPRHHGRVPPPVEPQGLQGGSPDGGRADARGLGCCRGLHPLVVPRPPRAPPLRGHAQGPVRRHERLLLRPHRLDAGEAGQGQHRPRRHQRPERGPHDPLPAQVVRLLRARDGLHRAVGRGRHRLGGLPRRLLPRRRRAPRLRAPQHLLRQQPRPLLGRPDVQRRPHGQELGDHRVADAGRGLPQLPPRVPERLPQRPRVLPLRPHQVAHPRAQLAQADLQAAALPDERDPQGRDPDAPARAGRRRGRAELGPEGGGARADDARVRQGGGRDGRAARHARWLRPGRRPLPRAPPGRRALHRQQPGRGHLGEDPRRDVQALERRAQPQPDVPRRPPHRRGGRAHRARHHGAGQRRRARRLSPARCSLSGRPRSCVRRGRAPLRLPPRRPDAAAS